MKNPFKTQGFDTLISKGMVLRAATMMLPAGSTTIVDGEVHGPDIKEVTEPNPNSFVNKLVGNAQATLVVNGKVDCVNNIEVSNITIIGNVTVDKIICEGTLAIKSGAKVTANEIRYRSLVIEDGAVVLGQMSHLDHISAGEQV